MQIILWTNLLAGCRPSPLSPDRRRTCNPGSEVLSWDKNTKQERKYNKQRQPFWGRAPSSEARTCRQGKEEPASGSSQTGHCPGSQRGIPRLKIHMNYNLIWLFWAGVTNSADDSWSLGSVDALALDVEEEALVALEVGARAALLAVLPRVPHHLAGLVHLGNVVMGGLQGLSRCLRSSTINMVNFVVKLSIVPQLRTRRRRFLIQRWCTCCKSLPENNFVI